jgi:hypothetical protein
LGEANFVRGIRAVGNNPFLTIYFKYKATELGYDPFREQVTLAVSVRLSIFRPEAAGSELPLRPGSSFEPAVWPFWVANRESFLLAGERV